MAPAKPNAASMSVAHRYLLRPGGNPGQAGDSGAVAKVPRNLT